jgi:alkylated DNA nucleotide flippase Atl1
VNRHEANGDHVTDEHLFHVEGSTAKPAKAISLAAAGLKERQHLQEWVITNPEILGDDILIVTFEFDRWIDGGGKQQKDRLDVLGLDPTGTLVVVELKRDDAGDSVELQAIRYAAMVSRFDAELLAAAYRDRLAKVGEVVSETEALARLEAHADGPLETTTLRRPRLILVAGSFRKSTTASAVWLTEMGLDVTLIKYQAYDTGSDLVVTASQLWPIAEIDDFTVKPSKSEQKEVDQVKAERRQSRSWIARLVDDDVVAVGTALHFSPATGRGPSKAVRDQVLGYIEEHPEAGQATWTGRNPRVLHRELDGLDHSVSGLAQDLIEAATGTRYAVSGPYWWTLPDGRTLADVYGETYGIDVSRGRDWSDLHARLAEVERGHWTSYQDLADAVGTAPQPLGTHVAQCLDCPNAYRVLTVDGSPSPGFAWSDSTRTETQLEVLESEGVRFEGGRASQEQRKRWKI